MTGRDARRAAVALLTVALVAVAGCGLTDEEKKDGAKTGAFTQNEGAR